MAQQAYTVVELPAAAAQSQPQSQYLAASYARPGRRGPGRFDTGLFECFKVADCGPSCFVANCICFPCLASDALATVGSPSAGSVGGVAFLGVALSNSGDNLLQAAGTALTFLATLTLRREIVERYAIAERGLASGLIACCCGPCSNAQVLNEAMRREVGPRRGGALSYGIIGLREGATPVVADMQRA